MDGEAEQEVSSALRVSLRSQRPSCSSQTTCTHTNARFGHTVSSLSHSQLTLASGKADHTAIAGSRVMHNDSLTPRQMPKLADCQGECMDEWEGESEGNVEEIALSCPAVQQCRYGRDERSFRVLASSDVNPIGNYWLSANTAW